MPGAHSAFQDADQTTPGKRISLLARHLSSGFRGVFSTGTAEEVNNRHWGPLCHQRNSRNAIVTRVPFMSTHDRQNTLSTINCSHNQLPADELQASKTTMSSGCAMWLAFVAIQNVRLNEVSEEIETHQLDSEEKRQAKTITEWLLPLPHQVHPNAIRMNNFTIKNAKLREMEGDIMRHL